MKGRGLSKKSKKERKAEREAQRAAVRRAERRRNAFTVIVIGIVVAIGGVLIWVSLEGDGEDELADLLDELEASETPGQQTEGAQPPVACGADEPAAAGQDKPTFDEPEQVLDPDAGHRAVVDTSCGRVVVELDAEAAPETTNSFVFLAEQGFYDGLEIFRHADSIDALQTGAGTNEASWQIGYTLPDELEAAEDSGYPPGTLAMANAGPGTSGSQFFFVYGEGFDDSIEAGTLEAAYTRFGTVVEGLDVVERIAEIPVEGETPQERVYMERVVVVTGDEPLPPEPTGSPTAGPTEGPTAGPTAAVTEEPTEE